MEVISYNFKCLNKISLDIYNKRICVLKNNNDINYFINNIQNVRFIILLIKYNNKYLLVNFINILNIFDKIKTFDFKIIKKIETKNCDTYENLLLHLNYIGILKNNIRIKFGNLYNKQYLINEMDKIQKEEYNML